MKFDLENTFFSLGNKTLHQKKGIPMGSPISPILAILVCAFYENNFLKNLKDERKRVSGIRYVDDAMTIIAFDKTDPFSKLKSYYIMNIFLKNCYHKDLILKEENILDNSFNFLNLEVTYKNDVFLCNYLNKNKISIKNDQKQKIKRYQNFFSNSPKISKKGVCISVLHKIANTSRTQNLFEENLYDFFCELILLNYPKKFLLSLLNIMHDRNNNWLWKTESFMKFLQKNPNL